MKKSALIIGQFTKTEHGSAGKLETLAIKATIALQPNDEDKDSHPDFISTARMKSAWPGM
jgi:uncharacterized protein (DUF736 family)